MKNYIWPFLLLFVAVIAAGCSGPGSTGGVPSSGVPATPGTDTISVIIGGGDITPTVEAPTSSQPKITIFPTIINQNNDPITNLTEGNFLVTIRPIASTISYECTIIVTPHTGTTGGNISLSMTLDKSGSMQVEDMNNLKTAANTFIDFMKTDDELGIISFSSSWEILSALIAPTASAKSNMHTAINNLTVDVAQPATNLYETVKVAIDQVAAGIKERKAVIAMTDGVDTLHKISSDEVIAYSKLKNVQLYTILSGSLLDTSGFLQRAASETGGIYYNAASSSNLADIYTKISTALRSYYTIEIIAPPEISPLSSGQTYLITLTIENYKNQYGNITNTYTFTLTL